MPRGPGSEPWVWAQGKQSPRAAGLGNRAGWAELAWERGMAWGEAVLAWCHPWPCRTPLAEEAGGNTKTSPRTRRVDVCPLPRSLSRQLSVGQANPLRLLLGKVRAEERTVLPAVLENRQRLVLPQNRTRRQPLETWTWRKA